VFPAEAESVQRPADDAPLAGGRPRLVRCAVAATSTGWPGGRGVGVPSRQGRQQRHAFRSQPCLSTPWSRPRIPGAGAGPSAPEVVLDRFRRLPPQQHRPIAPPPRHPSLCHDLQLRPSLCHDLQLRPSPPEVAPVGFGRSTGAGPVPGSGRGHAGNRILPGGLVYTYYSGPRGGVDPRGSRSHTRARGWRCHVRVPASRGFRLGRAGTGHWVPLRSVSVVFPAAGGGDRTFHGACGSTARRRSRTAVAARPSGRQRGAWRDAETHAASSDDNRTDTSVGSRRLASSLRRTRRSRPISAARPAGRRGFGSASSPVRG
jgi:hypothetical protein